MLFVYSVLLNK